MPSTYDHAELLVPDSIEPIIGWKVLKAEKQNGVWWLLSPQRRMPWPAKQRAEATCPQRETDYEWQAIRGTPRQPPDEYETSFFGNATFMKDIREPRVKLPDGYSWSWEPTPHQVAGNGCCCGIYFVDTAEQCLAYVSGKSVICKVAMWGTVVKAAYGARGQYAYPQSIEYAIGLNDQELLEIAELYGLELPETLPPTPKNPFSYIGATTTTISLGPFTPTTNTPYKRGRKRLIKLGSFLLCGLLTAAIMSSHDWLTSVLLGSALLLTAFGTPILVRSS